jgi:methionyl aminopeptidase
MTKKPEEIALLAESGRLLASVFGMLDSISLAGKSTLEIDEIVEKFIVHDLQARPASKGQYDYGFVLNSSINDEVCHGVPSPTKVLKGGDIVNFDITLEKNGFIADSSKTYLVGDVDLAARRLVQTTYEAMWKGIRAVRPGARMGDIGRTAGAALRQAWNRPAATRRHGIHHRTDAQSRRAQRQNGR